jgi:hypothetical protein
MGHTESGSDRALQNAGDSKAKRSIKDEKNRTSVRFGRSG